MEAQWQADRAMLQRLTQTELHWTYRTYAQALGRLLGWTDSGLSACP